MPVREALLRAEDGPDLEDLAQVGHERHLLVQLRRLREVGEAVEVAEPEDVGAALGGGGDELGRVDLDEALAHEELAEELAHLWRGVWGAEAWGGGLLGGC